MIALLLTRLLSAGQTKISLVNVIKNKNKEHRSLFFYLGCYTFCMIDLNEQKAKLEDEVKELEKDLSTIARQTDDGDWIVNQEDMGESHADPLDTADDVEEMEERLARMVVLEKELAQAKKALTAIENGSYGVCEVSGEKIPEDRLKAQPSATTTVEHAS